MKNKFFKCLVDVYQITGVIFIGGCFFALVDSIVPLGRIIGIGICALLVALFIVLTKGFIKHLRSRRK